jgi:hypothetical protein
MIAHKHVQVNKKWLIPSVNARVARVFKDKKLCVAKYHYQSMNVVIFA